MPDPPNATIASLFDELADLYELDGAVIHRVLAYRNAAKSVREAPRSVAAMTRDGKVTELPGIGRTLEEKIVALLDTGTIPAIEKLRARIPPGLIDLTRLPGLGPKRARRLYDQLGVDSLESLRAAAEAQKLRDVRGFGARFEESVIEAFAAGAGEAPRPRVLLNKALDIGDGIIEALRAHPASDRVELAGSARRLADAVKDLDIIATASDPPALLAAFADLDVIESAASPGENAARARTHTGMAVDLRVVEPDQFGNLLQHFTGSKAHNMALREAAVRRGLHVSEYGLLDDATGETRCWSCRGSHPSCARTAASSRCATASCRCSSSRATSKATCTCTRPSATVARTRRRWRCARTSWASSTSRSPTTPPRMASATTSRPMRCARRSRRSARSTSAWRASACSSAPRRTSGPTAARTTRTSC
jgi:DNA polymerase (family 10)